MKISKVVLALFVLVVLTASATYAQQQFTQTVSRENKNCNATCSVIDVPELNGNPAAIIFITPVGNSKNLNPHPIGAYYMYLKKWSIFNLDGTAITEGAKFNVEYYLNPDSDRFVYVVPRGGGSCIDHAGLNNNPSAQVRVFPTGSSSRGALFNRDDVKVEYDASLRQWCVANINNNPLPAETAYNIGFSGGTVALGAPRTLPTLSPTTTVFQTATPTTPGMPNTAPLQGNPIVPLATLAPAPLAPLTVVAREEWVIPDQGNILLSYGYCRFINGSYTNPSILVTDTVIVTGQLSNQGEHLTWTAVVDNGSVQLTVCNPKLLMVSTGANLWVGGRKVNILVLR